MLLLNQEVTIQGLKILRMLLIRKKFRISMQKKKKKEKKQGTVHFLWGRGGGGI